MPCRGEEEQKDQQIDRLLKANMGLDKRLAEYRRRWDLVGEFLSVGVIRRIEARAIIQEEKPEVKDIGEMLEKETRITNKDLDREFEV